MLCSKVLDRDGLYSPDVLESIQYPLLTVSLANLSSSPEVAKQSRFRLFYQKILQLLSHHQYEIALSQLNDALPQCSDHFEFWYYRGDALTNLAQYSQALESFGTALKIQAEAVEAWVLRAVCWIYLENPKEALADCDRALQLVPHHQQAWLFRGVALHRLGRYREAYASYGRALDIQQPSIWRRLVYLIQIVLDRLGRLS